MTWDASLGRMALYINSAQVATHAGEPWTMVTFDNAQARCRLVIPEDAKAVIDEIKIWNRP